MNALSGMLIGAQLVFTVVAAVYFYVQLKTRKGTKKIVTLESKGEIERLRKMRKVKLNEPLSEKTRPEKFCEIIGQEKGIRALMAAVCGHNPQHVLLYGPPGVGKTAAARIVLEFAKKSAVSPFAMDAPFVEVDATTLQFDERSIADPLIGSVHDPIYQGAGAYGTAGIPQPRAGAVTKAHGGVLFLDEIGELHSVQMNKLLKVLEDRKVFLTSSYYSPGDSSIPAYIHDIFKNGYPADFRLIGATTRTPEEIPPALRSRCTEIFFRPLSNGEIAVIGKNACQKSKLTYDDRIFDILSNYAANGRDAVNIVQMAASIAAIDNRRHIKEQDIEETIEHGRYKPKSASRRAEAVEKAGVVNGLAVYGAGCGSVFEIEAVANIAETTGSGSFITTGIIEEEELNNSYGKVRRASSAKASIENAVTILNRVYGIKTKNYDIHINFPGGIPIDGPSAGAAILCALYSAITGQGLRQDLAVTGEVTIKGRIAPVGGIMEKLEAAREAGMAAVIIPMQNRQSNFESYPLKIIYAEFVEDVLTAVWGEVPQDNVVPCF